MLLPFLLAVAATVQSPKDALARDAAEYARQFDVPQDEAERRLRAQEDSVEATDKIAAKYRDRLAGISVEHSPQYRIIVFLTGADPVAPRTIRAGGMRVPVIFRTGAKATRDQVAWAVTYHQAAIRAALPSPPGMGLDPRTGELVVIVGRASAAASDGADAIKAKLESIAGVPVQVRVLDRVDVNLSGGADIAGGSRVEGVIPTDSKSYVCTTGFVVRDGDRYGIVTAAHCLDQLSYVAPGPVKTPLAYAGQWGWGYQDVQLHLSDAPLEPLFYADTAKTLVRAVRHIRSRDSTRAGDFVCHRGERTGYSCSLIELIDFAPAGDLCGGPCLPTWVTVAGPTCKGGDSGSPVFSGTTAFGILKGGSYRRDGSCAFYFYMSVDYLPKGWLVAGGELTLERITSRADRADRVALIPDDDRLTQPPDVDVDGALLDFAVIAPDRIEHLPAREHAAGVFEEVAQNAEFGGAERQHAAATGRPVRGQVDCKFAARQSFGGERGADAAQHRLDPGEQFARGERLQNIIVRACFQSAYLILFLTARGQHHDRHVGGRRQPAQAAAHFQPRYSLDHPVEQDQVGRRLARQKHRFLAVAGLHDAIARLAEMPFEQLGDRRIILDDEDTRFGGRAGHGGGDCDVTKALQLDDGASGSTTATVVPTPTSLAISSRPP